MAQKTVHKLSEGCKNYARQVIEFNKLTLNDENINLFGNNYAERKRVGLAVNAVAIVLEMQQNLKGNLAQRIGYMQAELRQELSEFVTTHWGTDCIS